jgi:hypothetical protein
MSADCTIGPRVVGVAVAPKIYQSRLDVKDAGINARRFCLLQTIAKIRLGSDSLPTQLFVASREQDR